MRDSTSANGSKDSKSTPSRVSELPAEVYRELRQIAEHFLRSEGPGHTLQPTALVHEAFLRVTAGPDLQSLTATHTRALFAQAMRHILVDHARRKRARKRGGERVRIALDERLVSAAAEEDLLDLDAVLTRLAEVDVPQATLVELRIFGGMTVAEAAAEMGVSKRTAEREWTAARAWLRRELAPADGHDS